MVTSPISFPLALKGQKGVPGRPGFPGLPGVQAAPPTIEHVRNIVSSQLTDQIRALLEKSDVYGMPGMPGYGHTGRRGGCNMQNFPFYVC